MGNENKSICEAVIQSIYMIHYPDNTRDINFSDINTEYPVYNKTLPQKNDYEVGFIYRYFVKKINDKTIYEISKENYTNISPRIYSKIVINWKLTGKKNDIYQNKIKIYDGVYEYNKNQINVNKQYIPGLEKILRDPLEFWRPS